MIQFAQTNQKAGIWAWLSVNGTCFAGGRIKINGVLNDDRQRNARIGGDLNMFAAGWQYAWF